MIPAPLTWLRSHPWPAAVAIALLVGIAIGWAAHRSAPVLDLHQHDRVVTHAEQHQTAAQQVEQHQVAAAKTEQHQATEKHVHVHRVETIAPNGTRTITTDRTVDEGEQLELAQQVDVKATTATTLQLDLTSTVAQTATRDLELHQEPAPAPRFLIEGLAGIGGSGPVYGGEAAWSPGQVPLLKIPVWIGVAVLVPTGRAPMFLGVVGIQL